MSPQYISAVTPTLTPSSLSGTLEIMYILNIDECWILGFSKDLIGMDPL